MPEDKKEVKEVFVIQAGAEDKKFWHRCGCAFVNKDGSLSLKLDLFPNIWFQVRDKQ